MEGGLFIPQDVMEKINLLTSSRNQDRMIVIVTRYLRFDTEPTIKCEAMKILWHFIKEMIDKAKALSRKRAEAGRMGGRPTESKAEANGNQTESKTEIYESNDDQKQKQTESKVSDGIVQDNNNSTNTNDNSLNNINNNNNSTLFLFAPNDCEMEQTESKPKAKAKINFDFDKKEWVNITDDWIDLWHKAYPAVDIQAELLRMASWLVANPKKRKKNYPKAIDHWLGKEQDRGGRSNGFGGQNGGGPIYGRYSADPHLRFVERQNERARASGRGAHEDFS